MARYHVQTAYEGFKVRYEESRAHCPDKLDGIFDKEYHGLQNLLQEYGDSRAYTE